MQLILVGVFWAVVIRFWIVEGAKIPLIFIALWLVGLFGFPALSWPGYIFSAYGALLAIILMIAQKYRSAL